MSEKDINKEIKKDPVKKNPLDKKNLFGGDGKGNKNSIYIFIGIAVVFFILQFASSQETAKKISQQRFETKMMIKPNAIEKINIVIIKE